jgi:hypothetical protein
MLNFARKSFASVLNFIQALDAQPLTKHRIFFYWAACGLVGAAICIPLRNLLLPLVDSVFRLVPPEVLSPGPVLGSLFLAAAMTIGLLPGLTIALGQWIFVLKKHSITPWWILLSAVGRLGFAFPHFMLWWFHERPLATYGRTYKEVTGIDFFDREGSVTFAVIAAIGGFILGLVQYAFLRKILPGPGWYVLATVVGSIGGWLYLLHLRWIGVPNMWGSFQYLIINTHSLTALAQALVLACLMREVGDKATK